MNEDLSGKPGSCPQHGAPCPHDCEAKEDPRVSQPDEKSRWICEFCYRTIYGDNLPGNWDLVWQSAVCPNCQKKVAQDGGYGVVPGGKYAIGPDPRSLAYKETPFPAAPPPIGELLVGEVERIAAGKKLCGMCEYKAVDEWRCTKYPASQRLKSPASFGTCPVSLKKLSTPRPPQPKQKGLPVPEGVKLIYVGAPKGKTKKGVPQHQGVVTVAWIETTPGRLRMAFSFCSPQDLWCKGTGRDMAVDRLYEHALVIPFLYSPRRTVREVTRAVLSHDFGRLAALSPGATMWGQVPDWTKGLRKRMEAKEGNETLAKVARLRKIFGRPSEMTAMEIGRLMGWPPPPRHDPTHAADAFAFMAQFERNNQMVKEREVARQQEEAATHEKLVRHKAVPLDGEKIAKECSALRRRPFKIGFMDEAAEISPEAWKELDKNVRRRFLGAPPIDYSLAILARMMADIAKLGNY